MVRAPDVAAGLEWFIESLSETSRDVTDMDRLTLTSVLELQPEVTCLWDGMVAAA